MLESTPDSQDVQAAVRLARGGDDEALAELFERYQSILARLVSARLGPRLGSRIEVDDILQEVYLLAHRSPSRARLTDERGFVTWTTRIAENYIRKIARDWAPKARPRKDTTLSPLAVEAFHQDEWDLPSRVRRPRTRVDEEFLFRLARQRM